MNKSTSSGKLKSWFVAILLIAVSAAPGYGQALKIMAQSTFNGALTGAALGGATMALQDDEDWAPLRFGTGGGTIMGVGIGAYDVSQSGGSGYYVSGLFNDGKSSSVIVLLDTFYGAATGALLGSAVMMMTNDPIVNGLQYGSGVGAWAGFGFGLLDAFILGKGGTSGAGGYGGSYMAGNHTNPQGLFQISNGTSNSKWGIGLVSPSVISVPYANSQQLATGKVYSTIKIMDVKIAL